MNKRGFERLWIWTYYLILGVVLIIVLLFNAQSIASNDYFEQSYESKDLALLIDTIYTGPKGAAVEYQAKEGFRYTIGNEKVTVAKKVPVTHTYARDENQKIALSKLENTIIIEKKWTN